MKPIFSMQDQFLPPSNMIQRARQGSNVTRVQSLSCSSFGLKVIALAVAVPTLVGQVVQAAPLPDGTLQAVSSQRIDADEGGFPGDFLDNGDRFGRAVITIGDLDLDGVLDLVIGARSDDDGGIDAGAVYIVFMNADMTVKSTSKISATTGGLGAGVLDAGDFFGYSLATPGDLNNDGIQDLTVGAPNDDDGNVNSGALYNLFLERTGAVQGFQKISNTSGNLTAGNQGAPLDAGDNFGQSAGAIGDYNNDGFLDVAIGAPGAIGGGNDPGAVWLLSVEEDGVVASATQIDASELPAGTLRNGDGFGGRSVANIGDLDGDGRDELAVGAYLDDDGGSDRGAFYTLFFNDDLTVRDVQKVSSLEGGLEAEISDGDLFGMTVAPLGDIDGDGIPDIAVGSNRDDDGGTDRGALYFFLLNSDGTIKAESKVSSTDLFGFDAVDLDDGGRFGRALGFVGDLIGDCSQVLAVGGGAGAGTNGGAVWLLKYEVANAGFQTCECPADLNGDNQLNVFDVFTYIDAYNAGDQAADLDGVPGLNIFDVFEFLSLFDAGCP
ncbi:MAG: GC-type dockerin domain-anchored protein [Phycisphaerales bacterium]